MASDDTGEPGESVLEDDCELAAPSGAGNLLDPLELSSRDILDVIVMRANAKALAEDKKKKTECQDAKCPGLSK